MKFNLDFDPARSAQKIHHQQSILCIGSCFSEHIDRKLLESKFISSTNPFGIVFNPYSIISSLNRIACKIYFTEKDIFEDNGIWKSLETHTSIFKTSKTEMLYTLNSLVNEWHNKLCKANWLIITPGSAYYYTHLVTGRVAANCHKLPGNVFKKQLCETEQIVNRFNDLLMNIKHINPFLQIMFTVSPVKHLRDGIIENSLSKAILIQSVHKIINQNSNCVYFPTYELITDDLRDYRFYEADLAHPNKQAVEYVWEKFSYTYFEPLTVDLNKKMSELNSAFKHKPLIENTKTFTEFKLTQLKKCNALKTLYPYLNLDKEIKYFKE